MEQEKKSLVNGYKSKRNENKRDERHEKEEEVGVQEEEKK
jgi:hypothetical protein